MLRYYHLLPIIGIIAILSIMGVLLPTDATAPTLPINTIPTGDYAESNTYLIPVTKRGSVIEAMDAYAATSTFTYTAQSYPSLGLFISSIGDRKSVGGNYWILYVNGKSSDLGASSAMVSPGDVVEWKYENSY